MFAYIPALLLAATAAAVPNGGKVEPRYALHDGPVNKVCDANQHLVCCDENNKCGEIKLDDHNKDNYLSTYSHCTAIVACCNFQTNLDETEVWGDINQKCVYVGSLNGN